MRYGASAALSEDESHFGDPCRCYRGILHLNVTLVGSYYPPFVGGIESHMHDLARSLQKIGHSVRVVCLTSRQGDPGVAETFDGIPVDRVSWLGLRETLLAPARLRITGDIVHFHGFSRPLFIRTLLEKPREAKLVVTPHGGISGATDKNALRGGVKAAFDRHLTGPLIKRAAHVIALTTQEAADLQSRFGLERTSISVLSNALASSALTVSDAVPGSSGRLIVIARLAAVKRIPDLIRAIALDDTLPGCDIYGPTADGEHDIRAALVGVRPDRVRLLPAIQGEAKYRAIRSAVAMVIPSEVEANSVAAAEAIAQETPLIVSSGAAPGVPRGTCIEFPTGNVEALQAAIRSLPITRSALAQGIESARRRLRSADSYAVEMTNIYRAA